MSVRFGHNRWRNPNTSSASAAPKLTYNWTLNAAPPPAAASIMYNNAVVVNATIVYLDDTPISGGSLASFLAAITTGSKIKFGIIGSSDEWVQHTLTGPPVSQSGGAYYSIPIGSGVEGPGNFGPAPNDDGILEKVS